jgi:hypothetical protein
MKIGYYYFSQHQPPVAVAVAEPGRQAAFARFCMTNALAKEKRAPTAGLLSFGAPFIAGICILLSDSFVFFAPLIIPLILIVGMILALIALMRRERYFGLPIFGLVASAALLAWVVHRILSSDWHM